VSADNPDVSVIIPTHNRCASLKRTLGALSVQTHPAPNLEVIVVADGCTDTTLEMLAHYEGPFALRVLTQPGQGPGAARNHGAGRASGRLLVFLDDDVEPTPSLVEVHVGVHQAKPGHVVIGPYLPIRRGEASLGMMNVRLWWYEKFQEMGRAGHRYSYDNLLSGNLSIERTVFVDIGGFSPVLRVHEDYELGIRLIKAGIGFVFAGEAVAYHHEHETMSVAKLFERARQEGHADVQIGRRHPELRPALDLVHFAEIRSLRNRMGHTLAFNMPWIGDHLAELVFRALSLLERLSFRSTWQRVFEVLRRFWYLRGVADELGSHGALIRFLQGGPFHAEGGGAEIEIDLSHGVDAAEGRLDHERPAGARLRYGSQVVGRIPPRSGAEPLRGEHLRPILAETELGWQLARAMMLEAASTRRSLPAGFLAQGVAPRSH
jgi:glycosyltransferase involved in cell wall biosynthesis